MMNRPDGKRILLYIIGMMVLALGLSLNTKATLGVSPMLSISYTASHIFGFDFGNATLAVYVIFVGVEVVIHFLMKRYGIIPLDFAQILLSIVFTRFLSLFNNVIPDFASVYAGSFLGRIPGRMIVLLFSIIFTGIGAAMSLNARIIPNPGDGIVQAIADFTGAKVGTTKNIIDTLCVGVTLSMCFFTGNGIIGIGVGSIMAMLGVGRVIAVYNALTIKDDNDDLENDNDSEVLWKTL